jgi:tripartite-type tricarboxylate transporter receptor subunit TctC
MKAHRISSVVPLVLALAVQAAYAQKPSPAETAAARSYPTKPVRMVVEAAPGGATDIVARSLSQRLSDRMGRSFVVDNRSGAGGTIASAIVAKTLGDGYTLLAVSAAYSISAALYSDLPFDPLKDLVPISRIAESPFLLVCHPSLPVKNVKELIAFAKAKPGGLNFAYAGNGSSGHLTGELFKSMAGIKTNDVPYKGAGPAMIDVLAGQADLMVANILSSLSHVRSGKLRALALTESKRSPIIPELPTVSESGVPGYAVASWYGILAPKGIPAEIVGKLNAEIGTIMKSSVMKEWLEQQGAEPVAATPEEFGRHIAMEITKWRKVIKDAGIRVQ